MLVSATLKRARGTPTYQCGFTLIELMVVVTLVGVLSMVAAPSFTSFIANQRVRTASYELSNVMVLSRSEAIKRNADVTVTIVDSATGWTSGWSVTANQGGAAATLTTQDAFKGLVINSNPSVTTLIFDRAGRPNASPTFELASSASSSAKRCVTLPLSGVPRVKAGACS